MNTMIFKLADILDYNLSSMLKPRRKYSKDEVISLFKEAKYQTIKSIAGATNETINKND